jgi:cellulose synthase/poly-beta-1,6-N-acetylglucosamine synthase-like glycosyltransferase
MNSLDQTSHSTPHIDCVVIGVNAAATLERCLLSIKNSNYPQDHVHIMYVDGGSSDKSIDIARSVAEVEVIALTPEYPTPGLGRNSGWKSGKAPFVQFLDSDTILDPDWLANGVQVFEDNVAAVMGYRTEMHPEQSVFNWIGSLEWNGRPGEAESFGGDVLIRRQVLAETYGYNEELVGGEDPELSRRVRLSGWRVLQLDMNMTAHDLAMTKISQYWKRTYRSGYAFAAVIDRFAADPSPFWNKEFRRIKVRGGGFVGLSVLSAVSCIVLPLKLWAVSVSSGLFLVALFLLFFPRIFRVSYFEEDKEISYEQAKTYAWHCSLAVLPDICGVGRYYLGKWLNRPLRNKRNKLATSITTVS